MTAIKRLLLLLSGAALCAGCHTFSPVPAFNDIALTPRDLHPGDVAVITVKLTDKNNIVERVEGVLKEAPQVTFRLRDDGQAPDEKANDDVWTLRVDVPFDAPPGEFVLEFTAYRSDGLAVPIRNDSGDTVPLTANYSFAVQYAQDTQPK
ncbi:MAG: hypothetical protein HYV26_10365 [Candidatus Hydrogenedentes bacterium]|nr:hypothetical protein [Candidatus Hydrogenedentota bacterium]